MRVNVPVCMLAENSILFSENKHKKAFGRRNFQKMILRKVPASRFLFKNKTIDSIKVRFHKRKILTIKKGRGIKTCIISKRLRSGPCFHFLNHLKYKKF